MSQSLEQHRRFVRFAAVAVVKVIAVGAVVLVALAGAGRAQAASEPAFQAAFQQFSLASNGDKSAVEPAADAFETLLKTEPASPVLMAYAGASHAMRATTTMMPWKKMGFAEDGMAQIDKSLAMLTPAADAPAMRGVPGSLEVRFVAANTFLGVPPFMNRAARGSKLLNEVLESPLFAKAPLGFQGAVWMRAAALAAKEERKADAARYLDEVISHDAPQADKARALQKGPAP
jgi:hypothetical protein